MEWRRFVTYLSNDPRIKQLNFTQNTRKSSTNEQYNECCQEGNPVCEVMFQFSYSPEKLSGSIKNRKQYRTRVVVVSKAFLYLDLSFDCIILQINIVILEIGGCRLAQVERTRRETTPDWQTFTFAHLFYRCNHNRRHFRINNIVELEMMGQSRESVCGQNQKGFNSLWSTQPSYCETVALPPLVIASPSIHCCVYKKAQLTQRQRATALHAKNGF